jgi:ribonuclease Z
MGMATTGGIAMHVLFLGTGEAFDHELPNSSFLLVADAGALLVDCGFTAAAAYWRSGFEADHLDAVYLTHLHGDHYFGLPALLVRMHEEGRTRPLDLLTTPHRRETVLQVLDRAYAGFAARLQFELRLVPMALPGVASWRGVTVKTAATVHGVKNYAARFEFPEGVSVMVSGDGEITPDSAALFAGCDLVIHEAFRLTEHTPGHSSVKEVLATAAAASPPPSRVALIHTSRGERHRLTEMTGDFLVPRPGTIISLKGES